MRPLSLPQILLYSAGNLGANLVYAFANMAFPLFLSVYSVPNLLVGFLAQERSFVGAFIQPVVGAISDRLPPNPLGRRRPFLLVGVPLTAAALLFLSTHPPLWAVVAVMTVFSFFMAIASDPYLALMADIVPSDQRGRVGGVMAVFNMTGQVAVIFLSFLLWEKQQQTLFYLVAAGMVLSFAVTFFGIKEPPVPEEREARRREGRPTLRPYLAELFARTEVMKYLGTIFFFWLGNGGIAPFLTRFGVDVLGAEENVAFLLVLPAILGSAAFAVPAGLLTERFGKKPVLSAGTFAFGFLALVGGLLVSSVPQAIVMMALVGVANAVTTALIFPLLADMIPRGRIGEFTGIGAMVWSLSQALGALGAGAMADIMGSLRGAFALGGLFMLAGFALLLTVKVSVPVQTVPLRSADHLTPSAM